MIAAINTATYGMNAAVRRLEASAANVANVRTTAVNSTYGAGPVEQVAPITFGGPVAAVRAVSPVWRAAYEPAATFADADSPPAEPNADLAGEAVEQVSAEIAFRANAKTFETMQDMVKRLFDLTD
jgi:flagellar basal-body rod protein FlgC